MQTPPGIGPLFLDKSCHHTVLHQARLVPCTYNRGGEGLGECKQESQKWSTLVAVDYQT